MKKQINVPSIIFSRFNEDSSWKSKKFKELLGYTNEKIADLLAVSRTTVWRIMKK